ncbi:MAG: CBS domain-containing protein [Clostridia bacterium]|nr:CBS domain-containing protein [Clostridia bacterium]
MNILMLLTPKSEVAYIKDSYTVRQALEKMEYHRYSSIPIINSAGEYVGTITEGDLLWGIKNKVGFEGWKRLEECSVMDIPRHSDKKAIGIGSRVEDLFDTAMEQNFVPVTDDANTFIGIVTRRKIMEYIIKSEAGENEKK